MMILLKMVCAPGAVRPYCSRTTGPCPVLGGCSDLSGHKPCTCFAQNVANCGDVCRKLS